MTAHLEAVVRLLTGARVMDSSGSGGHARPRQEQAPVDYSAINGPRRFALIAAIALIVTAIPGGEGEVAASLAVIGAIAMIGAVLVPQAQQLGSVGSLLLVTGGSVAAIMAVGLLVNLQYLFDELFDLVYVAAVIAGLACGWAGWMAFQAEGGVLRLGAADGSRPQTPTDGPGDNVDSPS